VRSGWAKRTIPISQQVTTQREPGPPARLTVSVNWWRPLCNHAGQPPKQEAKNPNLATGDNPAETPTISQG